MIILIIAIWLSLSVGFVMGATWCGYFRDSEGEEWKGDAHENS